MNILFWITPVFIEKIGLYWLVYNKAFIAKFTLGPGAGEERKSQVDKCSQAPPPTHFHSVNVERSFKSECIRYACGKGRQYPGLERSPDWQYPSALPAAKRLNPCWTVFQSQRESPFSNSDPRLRVYLSGSTAVLNSMHLVNENGKEIDLRSDICIWWMQRNQWKMLPPPTYVWHGSMRRASVEAGTTVAIFP